MLNIQGANEGIFADKYIQKFYDNNVNIKIGSQNTLESVPIYYDKEYEKELQEYRNNKIENVLIEISNIIIHDEYIDGEESASETYMNKAYLDNQMDFVMEALMKLYSDNLLNTHILEGILMMIASVPYEAVEPKGQIMAIGLLSNKELLIRDRAIQCFEKWNSKKGLLILKSLKCEPKWLQKYVDKVITYIQKDGLE